MHIKKIRNSAMAVLVLAAAGVTLAACGSSNSSTTGTSAAAAAKQSASSTAPGTSTTPRAARGRFSALRECLQKEGVTLPHRKPGQRGGGAGLGFLGAGGSAAGGSNPKLATALKKCESTLKITPRTGGFALRNNAAAKAAYTKFATCMRENGVNLPSPNTSGSGPIFDTKGIDTTSPTFKAAEAKCRVDLTGLFRRRAGAPGAGAPPSAG